MTTETAPAPKTRRRPILKWTLIVLAAIAAEFLLLLLGVRFAAQSEFGRQFVEKRIEAADPSGQDIEIYGLSGDLFGTFRIERLTVADDEGVWLTAENVLADWKPLALRKRALLIEALEADLIHVMRRPNIVSNSSSSGGGSMPLRTGELDKLRLGELRTDEGVLPRAVSLEINGQGKIGQEGGRTQISVAPLEGDGDTLSADLTWSEDLRLQGVLNLDGPSGGLFATLARLEPGQSLSANLNANGTLDEWNANTEVLIDGETALSADARTESGTIIFDLTGFPGQHPLTRRVVDYLGDSLNVQGRVLNSDDAPSLLDLTAQAEGLELRVQADAPTDGAYAADIGLVIDQPSRYARSDNVEIDRAELAGRLSYVGGAARFDGEINATDVDVPSFSAGSVTGPISAVFDNPSILVRTTLSTRKAELLGAAARISGSAPTVQLNTTYDLQQKSLAVRETIIRGQAGRISAAGTLQFSPAFTADLAGSFNIDGERAQLARPAKLNGQFQARRANARQTAFSLRAGATDLGDLPAPLNQWSDGTAQLTTEGAVSAGGTVRLNSIDLRSGSLALTGTGQYSGDDGLIAETDLQAGGAEIAGMSLESVNGRASVSGPLSSLQFDVRLDAPALANKSVSFSDISLVGTGRYGESGLDASAQLAAQTNNGALQAQTGFALDGSAWQLRDFKANWGELDAAASLSGNGGQIADIRGSLEILGDLPDGLPAQRVVADAQIKGERVVLDASLETVAFGPTRADALVFRASGSPDAIDFVAEMEGSTELNALTYETAFNLDGTLNGLSSGQIDLTATIAAILGDIGFITEEPIRYTQFDDGFEAGARFAALGGTLTPKITTRGKTSIEIEGSNLRIAPLLLIAGRPGLKGAMNVDLAFDEVDGGLAGPFSAELLSIARPGSDLPPVDLVLTGNLEPTELVVDVRAGDNQTLEAAWNIAVPVNTMTGLPFIQLQPDAEIPFDASVNGQIEAVSALLVPPNMVLQGIIDLELAGRLPHLNESFRGTLDFTQGVFEHGDLGMVMNQIEAQASLGNGVVELARLNARGRSGGTLTGSGTMAVDGSARSDINIEANQLVVTERREGRATVSGTMELRQQPELLEVLGDLTVDKGEINIENLPTGGPATLDVNFSNPEPVADEEAEEAATRLDIQLNAPGRIDVRGRGVNAELAMDADISGSLGKPVITGSARIVRGRFDLIGKRFEFANSRVSLEENISSSPLNISATHETGDDIIAILNVDGTIDRPEISLTSEPVLPEDEVLSRVLFGRSPTQLSGLEAARLAAALAQLSGGGGFDLLGGIERALGLDTFDVGSGTDGDVQVTSGKYLTEDVYLEVRSSAAGAPGVAIEWEPVSNIEIEAATSTDDGQEISIQWKRDFDDGVFPGVSGNRTGSGAKDSKAVTPEPTADPAVVD
ncbi:MAG: translocation/assembly module TamB domain-containing protein [Pseudomonadota bacterium]|nr:translocation/assembly module TamB domain-containing protein [Pseudomonadota bacterium]